MKIAIIGTHSTGKTTLCQHLLLRLIELGYEAHLLPEFSRLCPYPINEGTTMEAQAWIQKQQLLREGMYHASRHAPGAKGRIIICDRASIDNLAYMGYAAQRLHAMDVFATYHKQAIQHAKTYDLLFKTRKLDIDAETDGIRSTDQDFRDQIDVRITDLLETNKIPYTLLDETIEYDVHVERIVGEIEKSIQ